MRRTITLITGLALAAAAIAGPAVAGNHPHPTDPDITETVDWALPTPDGGWAEAPTTGADLSWPQTLATGDECGGWNQESVYTGTEAEIAAILEDGVLERGEAADVIDSWGFVEQPACQEEDPEEDTDVEVVAGPATAVPSTPAYTG